MAQLIVRFEVQVLTTARARFKHLISSGGQRTWCNQIDANQATEIRPLNPTSDIPLAGGLANTTCPKCLHYLAWLKANSAHG